MFQSKVVEEIKTHVVCSFFFFLNRAIYDTLEKFSRAKEATYDNMARAQDLGKGMIAPWLCGLSFYCLVSILYLLENHYFLLSV